MTADECRLILKQIFKKLYPNCTVQDSYPGDLPRPPLPYIVLDFGRVDTQKVDSSFNGKDGILYQSWHQSMPLTVELVSSSKTKHTDKEMLIGGEKAEEGEDYLEKNLPAYIPVALAGRVHVKVIGPVHTGDYIVPSDVSGVGRAVKNCETAKAGQIVGYAVESDGRTDLRRLKIRVGR